MTFEEWVERWGGSTVDLRPTTRALNLGITLNYLIPRFGRWPLSKITRLGRDLRPALRHAGGPILRLAFPGPKGALLRRSNFRRVWTKARTRADLDGLRFHELRHTAAALAIAQGAHPLAIRGRLGHSSITVTMDGYGGLFPPLDEAIAEGLDEVLRVSRAGPMRDGDGTTAHLRRSTA
ncbi:MAG: tyrosine-type recombinase/integrase [Actinomycetia bacterium]|nr:tyrosine-type recombinase/integrase [Actinomycetes bacterium]